MQEFLQKEWKDYLAEHPNRRRLKIIGSSENELIVEVIRDVGTVTEEGDLWSAENMNNMESRLGDSFNEIGRVIGNPEVYSQIGSDLASAILETYTVGNNVVITQEEYNRLSDEEKNNGTTYYISDGRDKGYDFILNMIAAPWSSEKTYSPGDTVIYKDKYYKCLSVTSSTWVNSNWKQINFSDEVKTLDKVMEYLSRPYDPSASYKIGDVCVYNNDIYECIKNTANPSGVWQSSYWEKTTILSILSELYVSHVEKMQEIYSKINAFASLCDVWKQSTSYLKDSYVICNNKVYRCKTTHTSSSTWNNSNWELIGVNEIFFNLNNLSTTTKTDIISAINEINSKKIEIKELTLAEYNQLSEAEKNDPKIMYLLPESSGTPRGNLPEEYSSLVKEINNRIKKFYYSNEGSLDLTDCDDGLIQNLILYYANNQQPVIAVTSGLINYEIKLDNTRLYCIEVTDGENVVINNKKYVADYIDMASKSVVRMVNPTTKTIITPKYEVLDASDYLKLETLRTYYPSTKFIVNGHMDFIYPVSMEKGWEYVKLQINETRETLYDVSSTADDAYLEAVYTQILIEEDF